MAPECDGRPCALFVANGGDEMREITPDSFKVYNLDELEPEARIRAVESVAEKLAGDWWDPSDTENVEETILYALAEALGTPGVDKWGEGDFPGIDDVKVTGWDVGQPDYVSLRGMLTRENAAGLPWVDGIDCVHLNPSHHGTELGVGYDDDDDDREVPPAAVTAMWDAVRDAMSRAVQAGRAQHEYLGGEENAESHIEANGCEFHADGSLYL